MSEYAVYFDDINVKGLGIRMRKGHEHPLLSGTRDRVTYIPGLAGAYDYSSDLEPIPFNLPFQVYEETPIGLQQVLKGVKSVLLDKRGKPRTFKLKFGYEADRYYNVRYNSVIPLERVMGGMGRFTIPLICFEGHALSVAMNDEVTWGSTIIPFASDYTMGHIGDGAKTFTSSGSTVINVTGDNVRPVIHITGTGTDVTVNCGGRTFTLGSFTDATWLVDLKEYVVLKDGILALKDIGGDWIGMELEQGDNTVTVNGSGLNLTVSFQFRDLFY